jgi:hypothetical protein
MFKKEALISIAFLSLTIANAHAGQMGWTLQQCSELFGSEFTPTDTDSYRFSEHMSYWHSNQRSGGSGGDTHYFHAGQFDVYFNFHPDGTVGAIQWVRFDGEPFSEGEIKQRLKEAPGVTWKRVPYGRRTPEYDWQAAGKLNWIGGDGIFRANENGNGRGRYYLTIWTN